jgi:hypothetical protein
MPSFRPPRHKRLICRSSSFGGRSRIRSAGTVNLSGQGRERPSCARPYAGVAGSRHMFIALYGARPEIMHEVQRPLTMPVHPERIEFESLSSTRKSGQIGAVSRVPRNLSLIGKRTSSRSRNVGLPSLRNVFLRAVVCSGLGRKEDVLFTPGRFFPAHPRSQLVLTRAAPGRPNRGGPYKFSSYRRRGD